MPQTPCPYCGHLKDTAKADRCSHCNGLFEPLSQMATQLAMGPWYVRDENRPFMPGFSETILRQQVRTGKITAQTVLRGPTTNQFWTSAGDAQGVSRLMGTCHACHQGVDPRDTSCPSCKADLSLPTDVDSLGLRYTDHQSRAEAKKRIAEARASTAPQPAPTSATRDRASTRQEPSAEPNDEEADHQESVAKDLQTEDVWHAGVSTRPRRRRKKRGADPLVIGMGVVLLCVIALGGLIIVTSGGQQGEDKPLGDQAGATVVDRDSVAVSRVSVPALTAYERLVPEDIPAEFEGRYLSIRQKVQQAEVDRQAERFNAAYELYKEIHALVTPLESDIAKWQADALAKAQATDQLDHVNRLIEQARAAEAERWARITWREAEIVRKGAERLLTSGQFIEAGEELTKAEALYRSAQSKAQAGQAANNARQALNAAIKASGSQQTLHKHANQQTDAMLRLRSEGDVQFNSQQYPAAEQSYSNALDALLDARRIVEVARYKKFYAFDAGFRASGLMLAAARGDGVNASSQKELAEVFDKLGISPNPAAQIEAGDNVDLKVVANPLVNVARDAIIQRHGEMVQACYLIGFHANIIDQSLKTTSLTNDQQKRIHQSLDTIEAEASKAGWDTTRLGAAADQVRKENRKAKLKADPEATRAAWAKLLAPMRSKSSAPGLMEPSQDSGEPSDPELFPGKGA